MRRVRVTKERINSEERKRGRGLHSQNRDRIAKKYRKTER
jgi:hypothetical protein